MVICSQNIIYFESKGDEEEEEDEDIDEEDEAADIDEGDDEDKGDDDICDACEGAVTQFRVAPLHMASPPPSRLQIQIRRQIQT